MEAPSVFALERFRVIRTYLTEHHQAEVRSLSDLLNVSEVTVRRDLEKLEQDGFLIRTHGGAILSDGRSDSPWNPTEATDSEIASEENDREEIGETAGRLVSDGDMLLIMAGKFVHALSRSLAERRGLTILTNDLNLAQDMAGQTQNHVVLLGGDLNPQDLVVEGTLTLDDMQRFHVDRFIVAIDGFGLDFSLSVTSQQRALLIREGRLRCKEFIILCPSSTLQQNAFFTFGTMKSGDTIVTDRSISESDKRRIFEANIRLFTALNIYEGTA